MHRTLVAVVGAAVMSAGIVFAQDKTAPASGAAAAAAAGKPVTFVGCLVPGSSEGNFTLANAEQKGIKGKTDRQWFKVVPSSEKVKLEDHLTQAVEITGTITGTDPAPDANSAEKLPTFTATSVKWQADYCGMPF